MSEPTGQVPADDPTGFTPDYTADGVPTFDFVRDRIQQRAATADGAGVLDEETPEVRDLAQQEAERDAAGRARLEEIRRSMGG
jgi:phage shock protein A